MAQWVIKNKKADFAAIAKKFGIREITARLLVNRGLVCDEEIEEYLNGDKESVFYGHILAGVEEACLILEEKIKQGSRIRVIGDYDVDGIMSSYILVDALQELHAKVDYKIPDRIQDGYGLNIRLVQQAIADGVNTILTCDNGIAAVKEIELAKQAGMTVIVTDHHEIPFHIEGDKKCLDLPNADVLINPKLCEISPSSSSSTPNICFAEKSKKETSEICGAVVAWKLIIRLIERNTSLKTEAEALYAKYIPMVATATVCDVMELRKGNRTLVKMGLEAFAYTENKGLRALLAVNQLDGASLSAYHLGFVLGPCFNASGRLDTAEKGLRLLLAQSETEAWIFSEELKKLNDERKEQTVRQTELAIAQVEAMQKAGALDKVLVLYLPNCHESLAGIIAGRIREKYNRPALVLTASELGIKGSGRSIEAYSMFEELSTCKDLFAAFGGHAMAAGLTLKGDTVEEFRERLNKQTTLTEEDLEERVSIDAVLPFAQVDEIMLEELQLLEPCGKGNPKPVFAESGVRVIRLYSIGKTTRAIKMMLENVKQERIVGLYFGDADGFDAYITEQFSAETLARLYQGRETSVYLTLSFYPSINEYQGVKTPQIVVQHYKKTQ